MQKPKDLHLFPELVLEKVRLRMNQASSSLGAYTYVIESTAFRSERMLIFARGVEPVAVCKWVSGPRQTQLRTMAETCGKLLGYEALLHMIPDLLFAETIGPRFVVAFPWYAGATLQTEIEKGPHPQSVFADALDVLLALDHTTVETHLFDENDFKRFVLGPIGVLHSLAVLTTEESRFAVLAAALGRLIGQPVPFCVVHGDFEFGNLLRSPGGSIRILDWDLSNFRGPCMIDLAHLLIAYGVFALGLSYEAAAHAAFGGGHGMLKDMEQSCVSLYRTKMPFDPQLTLPLAALTILGDAANYLSRQPYQADHQFMARYLDVAESLLSDSRTLTQ